MFRMMLTQLQMRTMWVSRATESINKQTPETSAFKQLILSCEIAYYEMLFQDIVGEQCCNESTDVI